MLTQNIEEPEYYGGNIDWLKSGDIKGQYIFDVFNKINELGIKNSNAKIHPVGSVMIALSGQGKTRGTSGILMTPSACSQSVAGVKANILFFTKGKPTEKIWYYDLSDVKVTKRKPLMMNHFQEFLELLPNREDSERSWTVTREEIEAKNFDLKAVNLNTKVDEDKSTAKELLDFIEEKGKEVALTLSLLRKWER